MLEMKGQEFREEAGHLDATALKPGEEVLSIFRGACVGKHVEQSVHGVDVGCHPGRFHHLHQTLAEQRSTVNGWSAGQHYKRAQYSCTADSTFLEFRSKIYYVILPSPLLSAQPQ
jgi:hypothetical protein